MKNKELTCKLFILFLFLSFSMTRTDLSGQPLSLSEDELQAMPSNPHEKAKYFSDLAWKYRNSDFERALEYGKEAIEIARNNDLHEIEAQANSFVGVIFRNKGDYVRALGHYFEALRISEKHSIGEQAGYANNNLGELYKLQGNFEQAIEYTTKAKSHFQEVKDDRGLAYAYVRSAEIFLETNDYTKALEEYKTSLQIREKLRVEDAIASSLNGIGKTYILLNDFDQAIPILHKALAFSDSTLSRKRIAEIYANLAKAFFGKQDYDEALNYAQYAATIAEEIQAKDYLANALYTLSQTYKAEKSYDKALLALEKYALIRNDIFSEYTDREMSLIKTDYELQRKELELEKAQAQRSFQRKVNVALAILFVMMILLIAFISHSIKKEKRTNELLQKSEQRLKRNLQKLEQTKKELTLASIEQEKFVNLVKYADVFVGIADLEGNISFLNEKAERMSGFKDKSYLGKNLSLLYTPEVYENHINNEVLKQVFEKGYWRGESSIRDTQTGQTYITDAYVFVVNAPNSDEVICLGTLQNDITDRKEAEVLLVKAREEALEASRAKSDFLANMSHEIRTPLNGVIGFTDLLLSTPLNELQRQYAESAYVSGKSLLGIINDILDFSKIEARKLELEPVFTNIRELVEQAMDISRFQAEVKGLELILNIPPYFPELVLIDPIRLKQVLINLLGNAIKFTQAGEVELALDYKFLSKGQGSFSFSIRDTGIGISNAAQIRLFQAFTQGDTSTTRKFGGTGLGLAISKLLVEKMGSQIHLKSEEGIGSTFYFSIVSACGFVSKEPLQSQIKKVLLAEDHEKQQAIISAMLTHFNIEVDTANTSEETINKVTEQAYDLILLDYKFDQTNSLDLANKLLIRKKEVKSDLSIILMHPSTADEEFHARCKEIGVSLKLTKPVKQSELRAVLENIQNKTLAHATENTAPKDASYELSSILIAEDVQTNMLLIKSMLKNQLPGIKLIEARNGIEAIKKANEESPDLILMDIQMPLMDGLQATRSIRGLNDPKKAKVPIIALTAGALEQERRSAIDAGMDDFLTKPIDFQSLTPILEKYLSSNLPQKPRQTKDTDTSNSFNHNLLLINLGEDKELLAELIKACKFEIPDKLKALEYALTNHKTEDIASLVHKLKGLASNMYLPNLSELCRRIEILLDSDDWTSIKELTKEMEREWETINTKMDDILLQSHT